MTRIVWNKAGERLFETGVDQCVLYPRVGAGVPWNGVTSITEGSAGGEVEPLYYEGVKYLDFVTSESFTADITAYSAPAKFAPSEGAQMLAPGLYATEQPRQTFHLCYRTLIGNDLVGPELAYKLHLVWNCTAAPSNKSNVTIGASPTPGTRTWSLTTVPPQMSGARPTAHLVIDSREVPTAKMNTIQNMLYGTGSTAPRMPTSVDELVSLLIPVG